MIREASVCSPNRLRPSLYPIHLDSPHPPPTNGSKSIGWSSGSLRLCPSCLLDYCRACCPIRLRLWKVNIVR